MIRAEDKTIECMGCGQMLVLSGYNTTVCPACGIVHHELERTLGEGVLAFKAWWDRLEAAVDMGSDFTIEFSTPPKALSNKVNLPI